MEEYTSSKRNLLIKLRQKRITDAEFMDDVDNTLHKIDAVIDVKEQARTMFYQYVFSYFRLTSLIEDPEISDIHCIAYNKIRVKRKENVKGQTYNLHQTRSTENLLNVWQLRMELIFQILMLFKGLRMTKRILRIY